jgi:hypothetical protein
MGSGVIPRALATDRVESGKGKEKRARSSAATHAPRRCAARVFFFGGPVLIIGPVKPHGPLVRLGSTCCHASTCRLSTQWSSAALQEACASGGFILGWASHLDAFSGYPDRT